MKILAAAAALLMATPLMADEVWNSNWGQIVYQADIGATAVLTVPFGTDLAHMYVQGLGGNYDQRGVQYGYWISPEEGPCEATMTGPDGVSSTNWGPVTVFFDEPSYPSGFTVAWGLCMDNFSPLLLRATF